MFARSENLSPPLLRQAQDITPKKQGCDVLFFALKGQVIVAPGAALGKGATVKGALQERLIETLFQNTPLSD
jgi:hypothetical protein